MGPDGTDGVGVIGAIGAGQRWRLAVASAIVVASALHVDVAAAQSRADLRSALSASAWPQEVTDFYEARGYRPAWSDGQRPTSPYFELSRLVDDVSKQGLEPLDYRLPSGRSMDVYAELQTTVAALRLARHIVRGRVDPSSVCSGCTSATDERDIPVLLSKAVDATRVAHLFRTLEPAYDEYAALKEALLDYEGIRASGGWPLVTQRATLHPGDTSSAVPELRRRLAVTRDLESEPTSRPDVYDRVLEIAVRHFQERHGLEVDGIVGTQTFRALNVTVDRRIEDIELNLERWRWLPGRREARYAEVNIPGFEMKIVENGRTMLRMKVIVGTPATRTRVFSSRIEEVVLAPYWVVPRSIAVNEILPKLDRDPHYLERNNIRRLSNGVLRQDPGPSNPLGRIKFTIPNPYSIGLHDTPERYLFERAVCAFSHGCIRLARPEELALHLLAGTEWSRERIRSTIERWKETRIPVSRPLPFRIVYRTVWVSEDGRLQFRNDIYGYDDRLRKAATLD